MLDEKPTGARVSEPTDSASLANAGETSSDAANNSGGLDETKVAAFNATDQAPKAFSARGSDGNAEREGNNQSADPRAAAEELTPPKVASTASPQNQGGGIAVVASLAATTGSVDRAAAMASFKTALFEIIDLPCPECADEPLPSVYILFKKIYSFGEEDNALGYSQLVARYVSLWSVFERADAQRFATQALLGMHLLEKGQFRAASKILFEIEFQTSTAVALAFVMKGVGAFVRSLVFLSFLAGYTVIFFHGAVLGERGVLDASDASTLWHVIVAAISGMMGSVVSILLRLGEFETTKGRSRMFLMLTGATLPVVGGLFGAFVAALLSANIINFSPSGTSGLNVWLFLVIGFLAGFSERFSRGFIRIAEDRLGAGGQINQKLNISAEAIPPTAAAAGAGG